MNAEASLIGDSDSQVLASKSKGSDASWGRAKVLSFALLVPQHLLLLVNY
jgi:hypothetical protein